jgi:hypothetical protein
VDDTIQGRVVDANDGSPIANASVIIVDGPRPVPDIAALTDEHGSFALGVPVGGKWGLRVFDEFGSEHEVSVKVPQSKELKVALEIDMSVPEED